MPANRSRTLHWRQCLRDISDRGGAVEIAVARDYEANEQGGHLVWRVRLIEVNEKDVLVETPMTLGQTIDLRDGVALVAIFSIGQNRWMFSTEVQGHEVHRGGRHDVTALRLRLPDQVERCQRRSFYRVETAEVTLPEVQLWPLLDPKSVTMAERINEMQFMAEIDGGDTVTPPSAEREGDLSLPEVGPRFSGRLLNLGGGGVGLRISGGDAATLNRHKIFWLRFNLPPELKTPICASAKLVHCHMESSQDTYAGMVFDFTFNPGHSRFVADQICKYIAMQQRAQMRRRSA